MKSRLVLSHLPSRSRLWTCPLRPAAALSTLPRTLHTVPIQASALPTTQLHQRRLSPPSLSQHRSFSSTSRTQNWLFPKRGHTKKSPKGRPRVFTGGSSRGTTVVWGDWGIRMADHHRRVSAKQLALGADTIKRRLRGEKYRLYTRCTANIGVYTKGNEQRMGKGKGSFDYWAARVPVNKIIFEIKGEVHEKVVRDALRLAAAKMPGTYEFVKKGDPPVVGITKVEGDSTLEYLKRPRILTPEPNIPGPNLATQASRLPASTPP